jgi:prepilin-type processing-associated H-X9-DG protein
MAQCGSNLRVISQACIMHAQTRRGFLPLAGYVTADPAVGWGDFPAGIGDKQRKRYTYANHAGSTISVSIVPLPAALAPYLGVRNLPHDDAYTMDQVMNARDGVWRRFICPDTDAYSKVKKNSNPRDSTPVDQGTMMACGVGGTPVSAWSTNTDYGLNEGMFGFHYQSRYAHNRRAGNMSKIRRPSEVALFTDAVRRKVSAFGWMPDGWICWTPTYDGEGPATLGDAFAGTGRVDHRDSFDLRRHGGRINIGFLDGHVEMVPLKQASLDKVYLIPS